MKGGSWCPSVPIGLSLAEPEVPWHSKAPAGICPSIPFSGTPRPVLSGAPVQLLNEFLHGTQVSIPDLLHQGDVISRQDLGGQIRAARLWLGAAPGVPMGAWAGL